MGIAKHHRKIELLIAVVVLIALFMVFVYKPYNDHMKKMENLEQEVDVFLDIFCRNMGFKHYELDDICQYNFYCYNEGRNRREVFKGTYDYAYENGNYRIFVLQERPEVMV